MGCARACKRNNLNGASMLDGRLERNCASGGTDCDGAHQGRAQQLRYGKGSGRSEGLLRTDVAASGTCTLYALLIQETKSLRTKSYSGKVPMILSSMILSRRYPCDPCHPWLKMSSVAALPRCVHRVAAVSLPAFCCCGLAALGPIRGFPTA